MQCLKKCHLMVNKVWGRNSHKWLVCFKSLSKASQRRAGNRTGSGKDRGAVAVEFALVLPIFMLLVFGIFEFGRALNIQISLSEAARESSRYVAVHAGDANFTVGAARTAAIAAAPSVPLKATDVDISYSSGSQCAAGINVISTVTYSTKFLTGVEELFGVTTAFTIEGGGVMRCGG